MDFFYKIWLTCSIDMIGHLCTYHWLSLLMIFIYLYSLSIIPTHTVSWLNSSVTLLVSKAPLNRTVKNGCFWVDPPFRFRVQKANFAFLFSGGLKKKADPLINFPLLTKSVTWDTVCGGLPLYVQKSSKHELDNKSCRRHRFPREQVHGTHPQSEG